MQKIVKIGSNLSDTLKDNTKTMTARAKKITYDAQGDLPTKNDIFRVFLPFLVLSQNGPKPG